MKRRPILFSAPMVRAILAGRKTQTRRTVDVESVAKKGTLDSAGWRPFNLDDAADRRSVADNVGLLSRYGVPGDELWVRETWRVADASEGEIAYAADGELRRFLSDGDAAWWKQWGAKSDGGRWCPSIYMKPWSARLVLAVAEVRIERLQDITHEDAEAEGMRGPLIDRDLDRIVSQVGLAPRMAYAKLWDAINGKRAPWASNPWVWVVTFARAS